MQFPEAPLDDSAILKLSYWFRKQKSSSFIRGVAQLVEASVENKNHLFEMIQHYLSPERFDVGSSPTSSFGSQFQL